MNTTHLIRASIDLEAFLPDDALSRLKSRRDSLAAEMDKAVDAASSVSALKTSGWYQDRKELLVAMDQQIATQAAIPVAGQVPADLDDLLA